MIDEPWELKAEYPDLSQYKYIGVDCETYDPNLDKLGPGAMRGDGFVAGISIYTEGFKNYYPIRHKEGGNLPLSKVINYLKREFAQEHHYIGANLMYDLQWLHSEGITMVGPKHDIAIRDALIDENHFNYDLESIAVRHGIDGKDETLLKRYAATRGWSKEKQVKQNMWQMHSQYVGHYAIQDAEAAYKIYFAQEKYIDAFDLTVVDALECRLTDTLFKMWVRGIPVDIKNAEKAVKDLEKLYREEVAKLKNLTGVNVDVWSGKSLQAAYEAKGIAYETTEKGNPSFTADWLDAQEDVLSQAVLKARQFDRSGGVFVQSKIVLSSVNGRIHPNYKQTKTEDGGGTRSGRLSSNNPNLQQVPARNPELSRIIRSLFLSDTGQFGVFDYSQQEPRVGIHFASLRGFEGAADAIARYIENPRTDYHQLVADMCSAVTGVEIGRKPAKTINLGLSYGMGGAKLCRSLGLPTEWIEIRGKKVEIAGPEGKQLMATYDLAVPFVKQLSDDASNLAKRRGWVKTILGRRCNFPNGQYTHKAANRIIQGSSADMVKKALIDLDDEGFLPYNTVHDEVNNPINSLDDCIKIRDIMLNAIPLKVPLLVDVELGPSWGECVEITI